LDKLLRVEVVLAIEQCDFTRSNGQVPPKDVKDLLYLTFDTRDGDIVINSSKDGLTVDIDYTGILGVEHKGKITTRLYKNGDKHYVDFEGTKEEVTNTVQTYFAFAVNDVEETSDMIINDVTITRELVFELLDADVCMALNSAMNSSSTDNPYYAWLSSGLNDQLIQCDCMMNSQLLIKYVYDAN
jgi:hypothetical protein